MQGQVSVDVISPFHQEPTSYHQFHPDSIHHHQPVPTITDIEFRPCNNNVPNEAVLRCARLKRAIEAAPTTFGAIRGAKSLFRKDFLYNPFGIKDHSKIFPLTL